MNQATYSKHVWITPPGALIDGAAMTTTEVDTAGYDFVKVVVGIGATNTAMTVLKVRLTDTPGSGYTDITGGDFSVSPATLPAATDDNTFWVVYVDMRGKSGRYLDLSGTVGSTSTGGYYCAWAELSRANEAPNSVSERGVSQALFV